jgi:hypothetical protein
MRSGAAAAALIMLGGAVVASAMVNSGHDMLASVGRIARRCETYCG